MSLAKKCGFDNHILLQLKSHLPLDLHCIEHHLPCDHMLSMQKLVLSLTFSHSDFSLSQVVEVSLSVHCYFDNRSSEASFSRSPGLEARLFKFLEILVLLLSELFPVFLSVLFPHFCHLSLHLFPFSVELTVQTLVRVALDSSEWNRELHLREPCFEHFINN